MSAQAIFTQEQMDRVVEDLRQRTREFNATTKRFVSDSEWLAIDQVARFKMVVMFAFVGVIFSSFSRWFSCYAWCSPTDRLPSSEEQKRIKIACL